MRRKTELKKVRSVTEILFPFPLRASNHSTDGTNLTYQMAVPFTNENKLSLRLNLVVVVYFNLLSL